jgi:hypothetical protein
MYCGLNLEPYYIPANGKKCCVRLGDLAIQFFIRVFTEVLLNGTNPTFKPLTN